MRMATTTTTMGCHPMCRSTSRPSWLQATLADLEQRVNSLSLQQSDPEESDSFADLAENYYRKRPQLLCLLQDLYKCYLSLADRYSQAALLLKPQRGHHSDSQSQISEDGDTVATDLTTDPDSSDSESWLSFQFQTPHLKPNPAGDGDRRKEGECKSAAEEKIVAGLVAREVENEILRHEVGIMEKQQSESSRKMELQRSLLELMESERAVLLMENTRLGVQAGAMAAENEGLAAEVGFMRTKAGELARCVVKLREDHRVCVLGRKIEALQAQIYGLEKRNRECYEAMARREEEKAEMVRGMSMELDGVKAENKRLREAAARRKGGKWWGRILARKVEGVMLCGSNVGKEEKEMVGC